MATSKTAAPIIVRMAPPPPAPVARRSSAAVSRYRSELESAKESLKKARANAAGKADMVEFGIAVVAGLGIPLLLEYFGITEIFGIDPALVVAGVLALAAFFGVAKGRMASWILGAGLGAGIPALYDLIAGMIEG